MKVEGLIFLVVGVFFWVVDLIYLLWSGYEWVGTAGLFLCGALGFLIAGFLLYTSRRMDPRPEDRNDADISEGAGEIGHFSPLSYWPIGVAFAVGIVCLGVVFGWWLFVIGLALTLLMATGFVMENFWGGRAT